MPTKSSRYSFRAVLTWYRWGLLLLALGWAGSAAGQTTVLVPLTKQTEFTVSLVPALDTTSHPRHLPKGLRRYLLKYLVFGGAPGQPPAQRVNFLIGRDTQGRIVFVPAAVVNTFEFRTKDQQVLPAAPGAATPTAFQVRLQGLHGPLVMDLRPVVYPSSNSSYSYSFPFKQDLFLKIERSNTTGGALAIGNETVTLRATYPGSNKFLVYTDSITKLTVLNGQQGEQVYRLGESFLANGYLVTPRHISLGGDSLTVQLTGPEHAPWAYGNYPGLTFRPAVLTDVQGQRVSLAGTERPLVLDFWGTWCRPCVALTPALKALHQQYAATADIVSIAAFDDPEQVKKYLAANAITWSNVVLPQTQQPSFVDRLAVTAYPTFILIYKGKVQYRGVGEAGLKELTENLAQLR